jgi:hypothetical protein
LLNYFVENVKLHPRSKFEFSDPLLLPQNVGADLEMSHAVGPASYEEMERKRPIQRSSLNNETETSCRKCVTIPHRSNFEILPLYSFLKT